MCPDLSSLCASLTPFVNHSYHGPQHNLVRQKSAARLWHDQSRGQAKTRSPLAAPLPLLLGWLLRLSALDSRNIHERVPALLNFDFNFALRRLWPAESRSKLCGSCKKDALLRIQQVIAAQQPVRQQQRRCRGFRVCFWESALEATCLSAAKVASPCTQLSHSTQGVLTEPCFEAASRMSSLTLELPTRQPCRAFSLVMWMSRACGQRRASRNASA